MNKAQAIRAFVRDVLPGIPRDDEPALAEAWNNYTDTLCKSGEITDRQYRTWVHPRITSDMWLDSRESH